MNQEEADQDVADEVSEEADSRGHQQTFSQNKQIRKCANMFMP